MMAGIKCSGLNIWLSICGQLPYPEMEDEAADIELLEQHLIKTSNISQRMTSILTNFDSRLIQLEKSILPLHKSTQSLTKLAESMS